jgi:hypothetical protein
MPTENAPEEIQEAPEQSLEEQILEREKEILAEEDPSSDTSTEESELNEVEDGLQSTEEDQSEDISVETEQQEEQSAEEETSSEEETLVDWNTAPPALKAAWRRKVEEADKTTALLHQLMDKFQPAPQQQTPIENEIPDRDADPEGYQDYVNQTISQNQQQLQNQIAIQKAQNDLSAANLRAASDSEYSQAKKYMENILVNSIKDANPNVDQNALQQSVQTAYIDGVAEANSRGLPFEEYLKSRAKIYGFNPTQQSKATESKPNLSAISQHKKVAGVSLGDAEGKVTKVGTTMDDLDRMTGAELLEFRDKNPALFNKLTSPK